MGIHVHVKGQPDLCGCCAIKEKLDTLWNRASGAVLTINGVYPDAMGAITVDLLQEAAVQSLIEDYIEPMQDNLDAMNTRLDGYAHVFDDYAAIVQAVNVTIPGEIGDVQDYAEAIADDLLQNYLTKQAIISGYATKAEIQGLATRQDIQNVINGYVFKQGTATPQVISGSGGLQIAGDLAVGGDITASGDTFVHWDNIAGAEIGPLAISGTTTTFTGTINVPDTVVANDKKAVNGKTMLAEIIRQLNSYEHMVRTSGNQYNIYGEKTFKSKISIESANGLFIDSKDYTGITKIDNNYIDSETSRQNNHNTRLFVVKDAQNKDMCYLNLRIKNDGSICLQLETYIYINNVRTYKAIEFASVN